MRKLLYGAILAALFFAPHESVEIAKLEPVQTVAISREGDRVILETDTGSRGTGADAAAALADMKQRASKRIYLDTAQFLLIAPGCEQDAEALRPHLRGGVRVAAYEGGDLKEEAMRADLHGNLPKLRDRFARP